MTEFKYLDEEGKAKKVYPDYHISTYLAEIAHQLKRIADNMDYKK